MLVEWTKCGNSTEKGFQSTFYVPFVLSRPKVLVLGKSIWTWPKHFVINAVDI